MQPWQEQAITEAWQEHLRRKAAKRYIAAWCVDYVYRNAYTGKVYTPHHEGERQFVYSDTPTYPIALGSEGGGKSVSGIIKNLERLRRRMYGIMVSPDLPHFKKSLWPEFRAWCPWEFVVPSQRHRANSEWNPTEAFVLNFVNGAWLICGGIDTPISWEGPNVHFAHFDEARRKDDASAIKVLSGRTRLAGPSGEPPQLYLTTTPRMNWLHDYYGPLKTNDPLADFKHDVRITRLLVKDNAHNLAPDYIARRSATLTEAEKRVLIDAEWEDTDTGQRYLPALVWWTSCSEVLPPLGKRETLVLGLDAAERRDCFAIVGVTRHPTRVGALAVRYVRLWTPTPGNPIDFDGDEHNRGPVAELTWLIANYNVIAVAYDPTEMRYVASKLVGTTWMREVSQGGDRVEADTALLDYVVDKAIAHDGNTDLSNHLDNADRKTIDGRKLRIVKRDANRKIDAAVALSMAVFMFTEYPNL